MDYYALDNWNLDASKTLSADKLREMRRILNKRGYVVVLHSHFCGARGATPSAYDDFELFAEYLKREAKPGDIIKVWPFPSGDPMFEGKVPDEEGRVPRVGAY